MTAWRICITCSLDSGVVWQTTHQEVVQVLEQGDLAVQLDADLTLDRPLLHARAPGAGRRDGLEELVDAVRLGQVGVGPHAEAVDAMLHVVEGGEHDHGDEHGLAVHPQLAADVEAVDVRQHQVQEQHVGLVFPGQPQSGPAVLGDDRLEIAHPEDPGHESRLLRMVFHDQSRCHHWILRCTSPGLDPRASVPVAGRGAGPSVPGGLMVS